MRDALVNDLRFAQQAGVCVELTTHTGERFMTGVHAVDDTAGFVSLYAPQTFGDDGTTRKVDLDLVSSVVVTDVGWS